MLIIYPYWILNVKHTVILRNQDNLIIYPYWILNLMTALLTMYSLHLIIYPYWILNRNINDVIIVRKYAYNLSILDFKCQAYGHFAQSR